MLSPAAQCALRYLLAYLDREGPDTPHDWGGWSLRPVAGGANGRLFRATGPGADLAVKWTPRDTRDRAGREFAALTLLARSGAAVAPAPVLLDRDSYRLPVVVQSWLDGEVLDAPPHSDDAWAALVAALATAHRRTAGAAPPDVERAVITALDAADAKALVASHAARLPADARPAALRRLLDRFDAWTPPAWPARRRALCHTDANWRNVLRRPGLWGLVDWENSGWGDPAFDVADLLTHPAYDAVPAERWPQVVAAYAAAADDPDAPQRIEAYAPALRVWWAVRWARTLYEVPRGLDERLAPRQPSWQADAEAALARAVEGAEGHLTSPQRFS